MQPAASFRLSAVLGALPAFPRASGSGLPAGALDLLAAPLEWALAVTVAILRSAAKELHRAYRCRESEAVASVLGCPTAAAVAAAWTPAPRPLSQALLLGSRLVDLSAAHPIRTVRAADGNRVAGREGGLRPWFRQSLPDLPYSTAMRYRQLAQRLRQALGIPPALPLEWVLSDTAPAALTQDAALLALIPPLRRKTAAFLAGFRSQTALNRALERRLGIERCPFSGRRLSHRRTAAQKAFDLATDVALMDRYVARLGEALKSGRKLSPPEKRALAHLRALGIPPG